MNYKCRNCGGNVIYDPHERKMKCPFCDGLDCGDIAGDASLTVCPNCGGELNVTEFTSASRCPYCNTYIIYDERVSGAYEPDRIIPFTISKDEAVKKMDEEFKKRKFAPSSFLTEKSLEKMDGRYVPFYLYDYVVDKDLNCEGIRVKTWTSGNYNYTETSYYDVWRHVKATYDNIPADASTEMDDAVMDLIEPFNYEELISFDTKYMSGFFGEVYNAPASEYEGRARKKAMESAEAILRASLKEFTSIKHERTEENVSQKATEFALLPVWIYSYKYGNRIYNYYVNGQTGKVVGTTPVSIKKVIAYGCTFAACMLGIFECIAKILEVL